MIPPMKATVRPSGDTRGWFICTFGAAMRVHGAGRGVDPVELGDPPIVVAIAERATSTTKPRPSGVQSYS